MRRFEKMTIYWLDGRDVHPDEIFPGGDYEISPERDGIEEDAIKAVDVIASGLKSAVVADDYQQWLIFASEYVDAVIWFARQEALWSHWDEGIGFNTCYDVFEWLDSVHFRWTSIPMQRLYALARERYLKSLPTESLGPPTLLTPQQPLSPLPLGFFTKPTPAIASTPDSRRAKPETSSAHQPSVDCAASKPQLSPIATSSDANASPAVAQPSPMPAESILPTPTPTLASPKNRRHRRGRKKRRSERHRPSVSTSDTPHSPSTAVPFPIPFSSLPSTKSTKNISFLTPFPLLTYGAVAGKNLQPCVSFPILATPDARPKG
jgi:hypothetical protein